MEHTAVHDHSEQRKAYFKVFQYLVILTVVEVGVVFLPIPHHFISALVVIASCAKAALVGYYYMHLKQETSWLKFVALLPLILVIYLVALGPDSASRPASRYFFEPERVLPLAHDGGGHAAPADSAPAAELAKPTVRVREVIVKDGKESVVGQGPGAALEELSTPPPNSSAAAMSPAAPGAQATAPAAAPTANDATNPESADYWK